MYPLPAHNQSIHTFLIPYRKWHRFSKTWSKKHKYSSRKWKNTQEVDTMVMKDLSPRTLTSRKNGKTENCCSCCPSCQVKKVIEVKSKSENFSSTYPILDPISGFTMCREEKTLDTNK